MKLLAVFDRSKHAHSPAFPFHVYKLFILCTLIGGEPATSPETSEVRFFAEHELPERPLGRVTPVQIRRLFERRRHPEWPADLD